MGDRTLRSLSYLLGGALCLTSPGCHRKAPKSSGTEDRSNKAEAHATAPPHDRAPSRIVNASWYDVPLTSLAKRRAGLEEFTAAHNHLPIGTLVRVTHLANGKSVLVRITDRGITDRKIKLDLCKEAARELGMVSQGIARVRMQIVKKEHGAEPAAGPALPNE